MSLKACYYNRVFGIIKGMIAGTSNFSTKRMIVYLNEYFKYVDVYNYEDRLSTEDYKVLFERLNEQSKVPLDIRIRIREKYCECLLR